MPQVIPFAAAYAASNTLAAVGASVAAQATISAGVASIASAIAPTVLVLGASYALAKLSAPTMPRPSDGQIEHKDPLASRFFSYGRSKVSGPVLFLELGGDATGSGPNRARLLKIVAFGTRELAFMDPFFIDGTKVTLAGGGVDYDGVFSYGWMAGGTAYGALWTHLGKDDQNADPQLLYDYGFAGWTTAHRLRGIPYVFSEFESAPADKFQEAFPAGESQLATVGGVKVYDPRLDSTNGGSGSHRMDDPTTWSFSENQRLCCLDWLTWKDGYNKSFDRIDWASWVPQIAMADEAIPLKAGGTEPRYRVATIASLDEPKGRVLRRILDAGDQQLFMTRDGLIGSRGGVWQAPTVSLDATQILDGQFTHGIGVMDRVNQFELAAVLPSHDYSEIELPVWSDSTDPEFIDGIVRRQRLEFLQVPSNAQAQRLAKIRMQKINPRWSGQIHTTFAGLDALGEAAVNLSFDELDIPPGAFNGAYLVNGKVSVLPDRTGMTLSVSAIDPACYDWDAATEEQDAPPVPA